MRTHTRSYTGNDQTFLSSKHNHLSSREARCFWIYNFRTSFKILHKKSNYNYNRMPIAKVFCRRQQALEMSSTSLVTVLDVTSNGYIAKLISLTLATMCVLLTDQMMMNRQPTMEKVGEGSSALLLSMQRCYSARALGAISTVRSKSKGRDQ